MLNIFISKSGARNYRYLSIFWTWFTFHTGGESTFWTRFTFHTGGESTFWTRFTFHTGVNQLFGPDLLFIRGVNQLIFQFFTFSTGFLLFRHHLFSIEFIVIVRCLFGEKIKDYSCVWIERVNSVHERILFNA